MAEMRNNTAGFGVDKSQTSFMPTVSCFNCHMGTNNADLPNHTFMPNATACLICHDSTGIEPDLTSASQAQAIIDHVEERTDGQLTLGRPLLDDAIAIIDQMAGNRTGENLTSWMNQYRIAKFNLDSVDLDMSKGNHNPLLAEKLLVDSMDRSNRTIANLTPPDRISGVVATDMGSGSLKIEWTTSTAADFAKYRVYILSSKQSNITDHTWVTQLDDKSTTTFSVDGVKAGTYYVYVTAVDENGNEITNALSPISVAMTGPQGLPGEVLGLLAGLIIIIVVGAALAIMIIRRREGPKPPKTPEKKGQ